MVVATAYPNFREASCCKVEVVNGAAGFLAEGFFSNDAILKVAFLFFSRNDSASFSVPNFLSNSAYRIVVFPDLSLTRKLATTL